MATSAEEQKSITKRNWADEDEEGDEAEDVEIGESVPSQAPAKPEATQPAEEEKKDSQPRSIVPPKPRTKRERNIYGDFVVTKINIKEREIPVPEPDQEEEEEEESSEEEEQQAPEEPEEEEKKGKLTLCMLAHSCSLSSPCQNFEQKRAEAPRGRGVRAFDERGRRDRRGQDHPCSGRVEAVCPRGVSS